MRAHPRRIVSTALVLSLMAPGTALAGPHGLEDPEAISLVETAATNYKAGNFEEASRLFKAAYAIEPRVQLLYAWALAEENAENYLAAASLYEEFLKQSPPDTNAAKAARANLLNCRARALEQGFDPDAPPPESDPTPSDPPEETLPPPPPATDDEPTSPLKGEWLAPTLLGIGAAATIAGGVVMGLGRTRVTESANAPTEDGYYVELEGGRTVYYAGVATLAAGGLLMVGGAVRYVVVARRGRKPKTQASAVVTPYGFGLSWMGSF